MMLKLFTKVTHEQKSSQGPSRQLSEVSSAPGSGSISRAWNAPSQPPHPQRSHCSSCNPCEVVLPGFEPYLDGSEHSSGDMCVHVCCVCWNRGLRGSLCAECQCRKPDSSAERWLYHFPLPPAVAEFPDYTSLPTLDVLSTCYFSSRKGC